MSEAEDRARRIIEARTKVQAIPDESLTKRQQKSIAATMRQGGVNADFLDEARAAETRTDRIRAISKLMASGAWMTILNHELAEMWGVTMSTVRDYASQASRSNRDAYGDPQELRQTLFAITERITATAMEQGDHKAAIAAVRTSAELAGLFQHKVTHEHSGVGGAPIQVALQAARQLTDAELEAKILEMQVGAIRKACLEDKRSPTETEQALLDQWEVVSQGRMLGDGNTIPDAEIVE